MGIWLAIGYMLAGAVIALLCFMLTHRRLTPYLHLQLDELPPLHDGMQALAGLTGGAVYEGNRCSVLQNGALFPAMIATSRRRIAPSTWKPSCGPRAKSSVSSSKCSAPRTAGSEGPRADRRARRIRSGRRALCSSYAMPVSSSPNIAVRSWWNLRRFNHRTHRKLLIVDGAIGYAFGHGLADQWLGDGEDEDHWRDTAVRLEGPVARALQSVFMENWMEETHCVPAGDGCYPRLERKGDVAAHVVSSASEEVGSMVALLYTVAIASARKEVIIQNPYFAPDDGVCELFAKMVKRGVAVHLMVPGRKTDSPFVRIAGSHLYCSLLEAGVHVYEFEPTLPHQKVVIVDRIWSHVGSTNFDARSLALNEEIGVGVLDEQIARQLREAFEADLRRSKELQLERWRRRPLLERGYSWLAYQLHSQL